METKELADVTLISNDQKQLFAHKVFLSAGSEVFRNILINSTHKHPVIHLTNIKHQELEAIIRFIYLGKTTFYQDKMNDFLSAAKNLQVKEITSRLEEIVEKTSNELVVCGFFQETSNESILDDLHALPKHTPLALNNVKVAKKINVSNAVNG